MYLVRNEMQMAVDLGKGKWVWQGEKVVVSIRSSCHCSLDEVQIAGCVLCHTATCSLGSECQRVGSNTQTPVLVRGWLVLHPHTIPLTCSSSTHTPPPPPVQTAASQQLTFPASLISSLLDFRISPSNPPLISFNRNGQQFWVKVD